MSFGARLKAAMKASGFTQETLASRLGASQSTISDWVRSETLPEGSYLLKMPEILGVSGHWLLTGRGPEAPPGQPGSVELMLEAAREGMRQKVLRAVEAALAEDATSPPRGLSAANASELVDLHNQAVAREAGTAVPGKARKRRA